MQYQLVLQVREVGLSDLPGLLQWERDLTEYVAKFAHIDGHDFGTGEFNLFILTDDPIATFRRIQESAEIESVIRATAAAYRRIEEEEYTVIWPAGQAEFHIA
jgi:hypothetical protein